MKNERKRDYIDNMLDVFGYDYVIGFCLCSEYDVRNRLEKEEKEERKIKLEKVANHYKRKAEILIRERFENDL